MREHAFTQSKRQIIGYILHNAGEGDMGIEGRGTKTRDGNSKFYSSPPFSKGKLLLKRKK
jgi:hypothetical protein